jgi:hypothetical protein
MSEENENMKDKILSWLATGEVGASSKCMAFTVLNLPTDKSHPHDPDDFNRCLKLVRTIPEIKACFDQIAELSPSWSVIISNWTMIEANFIREAGFDWSKSKSAMNTYKIMRKLLDPIRDAQFKNRNAHKAF